MAEGDQTLSKGPRKGLSGRRASASADASRRRQIEREWAMGPRERALLALRLGHRLRTLAPHAVRPRKRPSSPE